MAWPFARNHFLHVSHHSPLHATPYPGAFHAKAIKIQKSLEEFLGIGTCLTEKLCLGKVFGVSFFNMRLILFLIYFVIWFVACVEYICLFTIGLLQGVRPCSKLCVDTVEYAEGVG